MQTYVQLWQYCAECFSEREVFRTEIVQKIKTHILCSVTVFSENRAVCEIMWENVVQATVGNMIRRMRIACWMT